MGKFRVLIVYPNLMLVSQLPNNIALLSAALKEAEHDVRLFDTTLYRTTEKTNDELRVERMQVRKFNIKDAGITVKEGDVYDDFANVVAQYSPNLIAVSVVEDTVEMGFDLIKRANCKSIPVIFGGVHVTLNPEDVINKGVVDIICLGEGEEALVELANCLKNKKSFDNIKNLWIKKRNGKIIKNDIRPLVNVDTVPVEDFTIFEDKRIYRPMQGKMVAAIPINFDRGCPFLCTFCAAPALIGFYKDVGHNGYFRRKSIDRIIDEMKFHIKQFPVNYFYFNSEVFLAMPMRELLEFAKKYSEIKLPFWCQTRVEMISDEKVKILQDLNCNRISIGLEHGNEDFRKKVLKKYFTNEQVLKAFEILNKYNMKVSVNNMIGFPDETRELVFDTIDLNRQIKADSINGFVFQPYGGTFMKDYCVEKGYISNELNVDSPIGSSILNMPSLSRKEIEGLLRTFVLYVRLPKPYWSEIEIAEQINEEGDAQLVKLRELLFEKYF